MVHDTKREGLEPAPEGEDEHESSELPRGALLLTLGFLLLLSLMWLQVYLKLLMDGGIAQ